MDRLNHATLLDRSPPEHHARIRTLLEFAGPTAPADVPDPYYGGARGFDEVLDLVESAADGLLGEIRSRMRDR
jgi:protein-tyrosine phosphatase